MKMLQSSEERLAPANRRLMKGAFRQRVMAIVAAFLAAAVLSGCTATQAPSPTPAMEQQFEIEQWAQTAQELVLVSSATRHGSYLYSVESGFVQTRLVEAARGTTFVVIQTTVINASDAPLEIGPDKFRLRDADGHVYQFAVYEHDRPFSLSSLPAGRTAEGTVPFLVPEGASGLELFYILRGDPPVRAVWRLEF